MATPRASASPQRVQSAAVLVPVLGLFLWMPPFITLFVGPWMPAGIPLIVCYLFGVWVALVAAALLLSRRLQVSADEAGPPGPVDTAGPAP
jgi:hypothetical protein